MAFALDTKLTPREVSFVADVGYERVLKAFEDRTVINAAERPRKRALDVRGAVALAVQERVRLYPDPVRTRIAGQIAASMKQARGLWEVEDVDYTADPVMITTFRTSELVKLVTHRLETIQRIRDLIVEDEAVQAGAPTFKGTRIMVRHIAGLKKNGVNRQEIAEDFPEISDEMIDLALLYDRLYPRKGRPLAKAR